jgi:hypothetical protein
VTIENAREGALSNGAYNFDRRDVERSEGKKKPKPLLAEAAI